MLIVEVEKTLGRRWIVSSPSTINGVRRTWATRPRDAPSPGGASWCRDALPFIPFIFERGFHQPARVEELRLAQRRPDQLQARHGYIFILQRGIRQGDGQRQGGVAGEIHGHGILQIEHEAFYARSQKAKADYWIWRNPLRRRLHCGKRDEVYF